MRNIGPEWRNLAEGLLRIEALEALFRAEWGPRLDKARKERAEAERQKARRQGRTALLAALVLALLLFMGALMLLLLFPLGVVSAYLILALGVPGILALYGVWSLLRIPDLLPDPSDLSGRWWRTVSAPASSVQRSGPSFSARHYGDEGEVAFVSYLAGQLSAEYVAVRGLLVTRSLDADVIVVGPTGVWVYEVKHWTGNISCQRGEWRRVKTYRERGGRLVHEQEVLRPFDKQWAKEARAVKEVLRRRLPDSPDLSTTVGGGLVFTHRGLSFSADGSCEAWVGRPISCVEVLASSPEIPHLTMERRLRAIDALLEWSDQLHERQGEAPWVTSSSVELAERYHADAVSRASSYVASVGESSSVISGEAKKARKQAFWHPHLDDPPKN